MKHALKKIGQSRFLRHSAMSALACALVIALNILIALVAFQFFYSFWFGFALLVFTPVWLICYGLLVSARSRWFETALGVTVAVFLTGLVYFRSDDGFSYKMVTTVSFSLFAAGIVSLGFATGKLARSILSDIRRYLARRRWHKQQQHTGTTAKS